MEKETERNTEVERLTFTDMKDFPSFKFGNYTYAIEMDPLSPEFQEVARKELRETPELQKEAIARLRELLKGETNLKWPDIDTWLIRFLRPCKYYPESAFNLVKNYYSFKVKHADIYNDLRPSREKNIFEQNILVVLPLRDQYGRRMLVIEIGKRWKHNKCSLDEIFKGCVFFLEAAILEPATQIAGVVVIFDMDGLTLQQAWQFTPAIAKRIIDWLQDSVPIRVKNIHIVNQPYVFNMVFALFKPILREKLRRRLIFHGTDRKSLHQYISPKCLPIAYGGDIDIPRVEGKQWLEWLLMCDNEFDAINSYGYNK
ncbi:alpha-tocopherol transfer protein-like isoform X1 [Frieseomelitta varia]|uniref:alpha-tocopherol transfer protein-like isoform X1 n=1 Tax=Frieseomelitta varia TaxID=561572 RepID=UPI001CB6B1CC|nr:alpha-tocopherol transfer protein-like isoform X1 [Frieseomelitta varia]